jgi:hypothetical protein
MKLLLNIILLIFISGVLSCSNNKTTTQNPKLNYSTSIDSLKYYMQLDTFKPTSVMWRVVRPTNNDESWFSVPGPSDYKVEAILQFDTETAERFHTIMNSAALIHTRVAIDKFWIKWLPKDHFLKDGYTSILAYNADPFYKSPLIHGNYLIISKNTIFICLYTM